MIAASAVQTRLGRAPERVLSIRLGAVGDVLTTLPALRALGEAFPGATLHHLVDEGAAGVVEGLPLVERAIVVPRRQLSAELKRCRFATLGALRRTLRAGRYDVVIDFQNLARSGLFASFCQAPCRIGRARWRELNPLFFNYRVPSDAEDNLVVQHMELLRPLMPNGERPVAQAQAPAIDVAAAERALADLAIAAPFVVIAPGSRWPNRALPEKLLVDLIEALVARGERVLVVGGPFEAALPALCAKAAVPYSGDLRLPALAGVIARAKAFIGADSAPMHMANLLGVPTVAIFGPSSPALYGPMFAPHRVLRDQRFVGVHDFRGRKEQPWFERIEAAEVVGALASLLARAA